MAATGGVAVENLLMLVVLARGKRGNRIRRVERHLARAKLEGRGGASQETVGFAEQGCGSQGVLEFGQERERESEAEGGDGGGWEMRCNGGVLGLGRSELKRRWTRRTAPVSSREEKGSSANRGD